MEFLNLKNDYIIFRIMNFCFAVLLDSSTFSIYKGVFKSLWRRRLIDKLMFIFT